MGKESSANMILSFPGDCVHALDCTSEEQQPRLHTAGEMDFLKQFSQVTKQTANNSKTKKSQREGERNQSSYNILCPVFSKKL